MKKFDRIETNFRLVLMSQREQNAEVRQLSSKVDHVVHLMSGVMDAMGGVSRGLHRLAEQADQAADRLEETVDLLKTYGNDQDDMRETLADCVRRIEALERKQAS